MASIEHELIQPSQFAPLAPPPPPRNPLLRPGRIAAAMVALLIGTFVYYIVTAKSVSVDITPQADSVNISGGLHFRWRAVHLLWPGEYRLVARRSGYETLDVPLRVSDANVQRIAFNLQKLAGRLTLTSTPTGAQLLIDGVERGVTPVRGLAVTPGAHQLRVQAQDYESYATRLDVVGLGKAQTLAVQLKPLWAWVSLSTHPAGAQVRIGERVLGNTSGRIRIPRGDQLLIIKLKGYKAVRRPLHIDPGVDQTQALIALERADGLVEVRSQPSDAAVTVDGKYRGQSPIELALQPEAVHRVTIFKPGYRSVETTTITRAEGESSLNVVLVQEIGQLIVNATPADAELVVDGHVRGHAQQNAALDIHPHNVEIRKAGYVSYRERLTPRAGFPAEIRVALITIDEARRVSSAKTLVTASGQKLHLIYPGSFTMGSPPRDSGRRANETLHQVALTRPYYLGALEVTNAQFRKFDNRHQSGNFQKVNLDDDAMPVSNVSWFAAASYCNWLSAQERLPPFYEISNGFVTGYDPHSTGYRLPTEAEWEYAARRVGDGQLKFPWGAALPPPDRNGNYADRAALSLLSHTIINYSDGFVGAAPVGRFPANVFGLKDMGGNVAEWVNDFYAPATAVAQKDPMGPEKGAYFVIKGSSWMQGSITELRFAFRDYGEQGRHDLGFRIARFAE